MGHGRLKLEASESVAEIGRADGLWVVGREADITHRQILARDAILLNGQAGLRGTPTWARRQKAIVS